MHGARDDRVLFCSDETLVTISTLAELAAPLSETEFLTRLHERRLTLLRSSGENPFDELISWRVVTDLLESMPLERIQVTREMTTVPRMLFVEAGRPSLSRISRLLEQGASLILRRLHESVPGLEALRRNIAGRTRDRLRATGVVTTGSGGALRFHYDVPDVVVLQIEGSKRWRIYDQPVVNPVHGMSRHAPSRDRVVFDDVVHAGDRLIVPSGYWHECENAGGRSFHVAVQFEPLSAQRVMEALALQMASEEADRRPLARRAEPLDLAELEEELKALLISKVSRLSLADLLARHQVGQQSDEY